MNPIEIVFTDIGFQFSKFSFCESNSEVNCEIFRSSRNLGLSIVRAMARTSLFESPSSPPALSVENKILLPAKVCCLEFQFRSCRQRENHRSLFVRRCSHLSLRPACNSNSFALSFSLSLSCSEHR